MWAEVLDGSDVSSCAADGGVRVGVEAGVEVEVGSKRYTGCYSGRLKRGSGAQNNIALGHSLVGEDQTWRVYQSRASVVVVVVGVVDVVHVGGR